MKQEQVYTGYLIVAGKRLQVDFEAPEGATRDELDLAFLRALVRQGVLWDYLALGEVDHGSRRS